MHMTMKTVNNLDSSAQKFAVSSQAIANNAVNHFGVLVPSIACVPRSLCLSADEAGTQPDTKRMRIASRTTATADIYRSIRRRVRIEAVQLCFTDGATFNFPFLCKTQGSLEGQQPPLSRAVRSERYQ